MQRYVFPDGELAPVSKVNLMAEAAGFEVRDMENLREHYALTLRHWVRRLEARETEAIQAGSETTYRTWRLYMSASAYGFETANINVNQTLLAKPLDGKCNLPLTRADLYLPGPVIRKKTHVRNTLFGAWDSRLSPLKSLSRRKDQDVCLSSSKSFLFSISNFIHKGAYGESL